MENKRGTNIDPTIEYYEKNAAAFIESTINANVSDLYKPFEKLLTPECRILDLGCGSGRDSKYFAEKGYDVVALDPSPAMCAQTRSLVHIPVYEMSAEEMQFSNEFDGVWACASLLHVPRDFILLFIQIVIPARRDQEGILGGFDGKIVLVKCHQSALLVLMHCSKPSQCRPAHHSLRKQRILVELVV